MVNCARCNGLMVISDCLDPQAIMGELWIQVLRCVLCGNIEDPRILEHRNQKEGMPVLPLKKRRRAPRPPVARLTA